ncbi:hypothetical protein LUZ61_016029 [Rhynchospora tenuis]|uniref:Alpha-glucosidase n=1 Tax=Rhynchospora tenuis TaxID=198213 RepID=A0AAD6EJE7_9POAL|nr:hypothetical protein LUZ61_016029 [Rhynchospora tenuis]
MAQIQYKNSKKHHKHINNPFPSAPKSLPLIHSKLSFDNEKLSHARDFSIGENFNLTWVPTNGDEEKKPSNKGGYLFISHQSELDKTIWSTVPGEAFISGAAVETEVEESRGSFAIKDGEVMFISRHQTIEKILSLYKSDLELESKGREYNAIFGDSYTDHEWTHFPIVVITGLLLCTKNVPKSRKRLSVTARYWFLLEQKNSTQVSFSVNFGEYNYKLETRPLQKSKFYYKSSKLHLRRPRSYFSDFSINYKDEEQVNETLNLKGFGEFNRVYVTFSSETDERFYGFGEQFSCMEFKGKKVPILVQEQGIGRGDQPITFAANLVSHRSGGDWSTTYAPSPFYMTSKMRSLYLEGYNYSIFDLTKHDRVQVQIHGSHAKGRILFGSSPDVLIESYTETIGRPPPLPNWILSGAIVGMQGGTGVVRQVWDQLQDFDVPISAFWLQDWVGQRKTIIGSQLWWNWELDHMHYYGWRELVNDLTDHNIRVMAYCNPCLAPIDGKANKIRNFFEEAKAKEMLVRDENGEHYLISNTCFDVGMLDLTNPGVNTWFKSILQEMVDCGIRGWMADFGEGLPIDAHLYSGEDPVEAHNRYPEMWAQVNREFVEEWRLKHPEEESLVFFVRAGFRESSKWAMLFWEGDQMVSWQANDGIKSSIVGLLSSGISGIPFNHSDIGGYCGVDMPFLKYKRSEELLMRWMELNAFSVVFRTHEGNKPSSNCQFYSNKWTLSHFSRCAKLYKAWMFYRLQLVKEATTRGLPVVRHLFLHYPQDKRVQRLTYQQFLVGTDIMVVPVVDKGKKSVNAYFPLSSETHSWLHIWTGEVYNQQGFEAEIEAPVGYPAVFVKTGSEVGQGFLRNLKEFNIL